MLALCASCHGTSGTLVYLTDSAASAGAGGTPSGAPQFLPSPGTTWQVQLTGTLDSSFDVQFYELDLFALDPKDVQTLHDAGRALGCYVSVGSAEPWRPDYANFPSSALGKPLADYPQELWLDVRDAGVRQVMTQRLQLAASSGCQAVELSNLQAYSEDSGFPLTQADELSYAQSLIEQCHALGLSAGISAGDDLVPALVPSADWGLTEECLSYDDCAAWQPFTNAGKAVFMIEYGSSKDAPVLCPEAAKLGFSLAIKRRALDAFRVGCEVAQP